MKKTKILALFFLVMSLVSLLAGVGHQLEQKRRQVLCHARLRHWGTAFRIYYRQRNDQWQLSEQHSDNQWFLQVRSYLENPETEHCPNAEHNLSYKVNGHVAPVRRPAFANVFPKNLVLLFDGDDGGQNIVREAMPYSRVANRHLGGANLLLIDGSVVYCNAYSLGIATGKTGWKNAGGYSWSFSSSGEK